MERFESHRKQPNESDDIVFARYQWNAEICQHFYGPLRILEVALRNSFDQAIGTKTNDHNWLTKIPESLGENQEDDVRAAHSFLNQRKRPVTQARVVQEMSFGFWTSLLNGRYETLFHSIGAKVFPGLPKTNEHVATPPTALKASEPFAIGSSTFGEYGIVPTSRTTTTKSLKQSAG